MRDLLINGLIAIAVAAVTAFLTSRHTARVYNRELRRKRYEDIDALYTNWIAGIEKAIRATTSFRNDFDAMTEFPDSNAKFLLHGTPEIVAQSMAVSDVLFHWSTAFKRGMPKRIGDTNMAYSSTTDLPHVERAKELYPKLMEEIEKMTNLMKAHLQELSA